MTLYQVTSSWDENAGWFNQPTASQLASLPAPTVGQPYSIDITDAYNKWKAGTAQNFGLELRPTTNDNRFNVFRSSDYQASPSLRPMLRVTVSVPSRDHFTWPIDPANPSAGFYSSCADNPRCFWLNTGGWHDVQPFLRYDYIDNTGKNYGYHLGADWNLDPVDAGLPVSAVADGEVVSVQPNVAGWGNVIFVQHATTFGTYTSMYAHVDWMPSGPPSLGPTTRGKQLAVVGNGGGLYPYHLHLEIRNGSSTAVGPGYVSSPSTVPPQGQVDPDAFIAVHR
jgi:murein DD-endopeptidase MepM/ murein hydrolase activator NlpD